MCMGQIVHACPQLDKAEAHDLFQAGFASREELAVQMVMTMHSKLKRNFRRERSSCTIALRTNFPCSNR